MEIKRKRRLGVWKGNKKRDQKGDNILKCILKAKLEFPGRDEDEKGNMCKFTDGVKYI